ncbi:type II toxin-antitoxin system VapC family toxin [Geminocystis herdmanii]|uniref:type II toxin-antitoxin system VapC family toxin n=1 Tax=Geminocystis herdmanii TaxID=669359 RepID=UPI00036D0A5B|nr:type II toxin-antitoxin system VapC family toxin [Geminocystis herdmanii]
MNLYILDTDYLSLYGRNHPPLITRLLKSQVQLTTTAINVEEQLRGRLAQVTQAKEGLTYSVAYQRLIETVMLLSESTILPYETKSDEIYQNLKSQRIRVGTQDLRIASIAIAHNAILLTRNLQDFEKIPGLVTEKLGL